MTESAIKFGIQLPGWAEREVRIQAKLHGVSRATMAALMIHAFIRQSYRVEERAVISNQLDAIAQMEGLSTEELIQQWLSAED